jgi:hypothetical protein
VLELPVGHQHTLIEISLVSTPAWSAWFHGAGARLTDIGRHADAKSYQGMSEHYETASGAIGVNVLAPERRQNGLAQREE